LSKTLLSRLVIVDDGILTFNAYKSKKKTLTNFVKRLSVN